MAAIYQRSRPIHWDEVVGQEHVKDVLRPALERGRIGHAYLFSGPRGVGKTTTARLIAMTVNCDDANAVKPCGVCESCRMVISGRHPDVLEIDAASNNSVDDVRDLREKVALQPMRGSSKVYILDEAHMMSKSAFNALLKTLEEPPAHVVFILATTEPERLPATILSRCQHYRFRRLSVEEICGKLEGLAAKEGVNAQREALMLIARTSDGAMRDGESLLERMLASGEPVLTVANVEGALGLPPQERMTNLALELARANPAGMLTALGGLYQDGFAPRTVTERTKIALRDLLHAQLGIGIRPAHDSIPETRLLKLIRTLDEEDGRFARASDLISLEMAFTRALLAGDESSGGGENSGNLEGRLAKLEQQLRDGGGATRTARPVPDFDPMSRQSRPAAAVKETPQAAVSDRADVPPRPPTPAAVASSSGAPSSGTWGDVILKAKPQLKAFLREAQPNVADNVLVLTYSAKHKWHADQVASKLEELSGIVKNVFGDHFALELVLPDGSKKNSGIRTDNPQLTPRVETVARASEVVASVMEVIETRVEVQAEPAIKPMLEPSQDDVVLEPARGKLEPESLPQVITQRVTPAFALGGTITVTHSSIPATLEFEALGVANPEPNLFEISPSEPDPEPMLLEAPSLLERSEALESTLLERSEALESTLLEMPIETSELESAPPEDSDFAPWLETEGTGLAITSIDVLEDAAPLEAFGLDLGDLDAPVMQAVGIPALKGHPTYQKMAKLFKHRVREAGLPEVTQTPEVIVAPVVEESEV
jgi:DNA polymerase III subunit gamma/tau